MRATRHCQTAAIRREGTGLFIALGNINYDVFCMGSSRDVMFRETGGVVVEESAEVRCLQERTLEEPAVLIMFSVTFCYIKVSKGLDFLEHMGMIRERYSSCSLSHNGIAEVQR